jgi:FkbM family methyltransferase
VVAFEPGPTTYRLLVDNPRRAGAANVEAVNIGLGSRSENLTITFAENNRSGGYVSDRIRPQAGHVTEAICLDTLDHFFSTRDSVPDFLKIDVEGFELKVLRGAERLLREKRPPVVMEMNHFCLDVLHRIALPDFLDEVRRIFPNAYAIDADNRTIEDLHDSERAYFVMYQHVVHHRFANLVCGFDASIRAKLNRLAETAVHAGGPADVRGHWRVQRERWRRRLQDSFGRLKLRPQPFQTPPVGGAKGNMESDALPARAAPGELMEIHVNIANNSELDWYGSGTHPVRLCYHWFGAGGQCTVHDGMRTDLTEPVIRAGASVHQPMNIRAPAEAGRYQLVLTLVQEGICWFEERGFEPLERWIEVK